MKKLLFLVLTMGNVTNITAQNIGIGTTTPNPSAILDVSSTTKGMLLPRMTTVQRNAIVNPAQGLIVFNTDDQCTDVFDGLRWIKNCGFKQLDSVTVPGNSWKRLVDIGGAARYQPVGFAIGSKGYVTGGAGRSDLWEFDPATQAWTQKASLAQLSRVRANGFSIGSKGYVGMGYSTGYLKDLWEYDPVLNSWTQKADLPAVPRENAVAFSIGNKGYIGTGFDGANYLYDFWEFDPATNNWVQKANVLLPSFNMVGFSIGTKGYVTRPTYNDLFEYDQLLNSWSPKATLPGPSRVGGIGFSAGNKGYVGLGSSNGSLLTDLWQYDPATNSWTQKADFDGQGRAYPVGFAIGNKGYAGTGLLGSVDDFWEYRPDPIQAPSFISAFSSPSVSQVSDGIWTRSTLTEGQPAITASGLIGLNVSDPQFSFDAKGPVRLRSLGIANTAGIWMNNGNNTDTTLFMGMMDDNTGGFYSNGTWKWVVNGTTGNTGIGTTSPTAKLHVAGTSYLAGNVGIATATAAAPLHVTGSTILNGNVGVGVGIPSFPLTMFGGFGDKISLSGNTPGTSHYGFGIQNNLLQMHSSSSSTDIALGYGYSTAFTETMRIKGNGNVGIGTANPTKPLEVVGGPSAIPVAMTIGNKGGFGPAALEFISDHGTPNQWRPGYIRSNDLGSFTGSLEFYTNGTGSTNLNGNVKGLEVRNGITYTATGSVSSFSDARLKRNVQPFTGGLNIINQINPVSFYYNKLAPFQTDKLQIGVLAQELEKVAPYMVEKNESKEMPDMLSVNNQAYIFLLINAVKEQQKEIEELKRRLDQLEHK